MRHSICEIAMMRNITVSIDEETHRLARIRAAELDTSVSALVRGYLKSLAGCDGAEPTPALPSEAERRRSKLREVIERITANDGGLRMAENLSREELYDRARAEAKGGTSTAIDNGNPKPG